MMYYTYFYNAYKGRYGNLIKVASYESAAHCSQTDADRALASDDKLKPNFL